MSVHNSYAIKDQKINDCNSTKPAIRFFQIHESKDNHHEINEGFTPLYVDHRLNKPWGEWWTIRQYLIQNNINSRDLYGFIPSYGKTSITKLMNVRQNIDENLDIYTDVITMSPDQDSSAFFRNPFLHLESLRPGILDLMQSFINESHIKLDLKNLVMASESTINNQCFLARGNFWIDWLELFEKLIDFANRKYLLVPDTDSTQAKSAFSSVPCLTLMAGHLANFLLAQEKFNIKNINNIFAQQRIEMDKTEVKQIIAKSLKLAYAKTCSPEYINIFDQLNDFI
jgi:hypothetical protein